MTFDELNLNKPLLSALEDLGYSTPTPIQQKVFSVVMSGADVCGIAQTGTGKTVAYLLPLLRMWTYRKVKDPQILILVPTRELVMQVVETIKKLSAFTSLVAEGVYGGTNMNTQKTALEGGMDVVVATPGRFYDLAMAGAIKTKSLKKLVIDEVDEMLNLGFRKQIQNILELLPERRQNLLFSATLIEEVEQLMNTYFNEPVRIEAAPAGTPVDGIEQVAYLVPNFNTKVNLLIHLLNGADMTRVLVFAGTKKMADEIFEKVGEQFNEQAGVIHSNKDQNYRFNAVKRFETGEYRILIATDLVARGIDVAEVSHVINFDVPEVPENYVHRIGRTGRADKKGHSITLVTEQEKGRIEAAETLMNRAVIFEDLPADVVVSTILTADEMPKPFIVPEVKVKIAGREGAGPAFHEKSAKNQKVNKKASRRDQMKKKYGKPLTKRGKRK